jgi:hypothetical protein
LIVPPVAALHHAVTFRSLAEAGRCRVDFIRAQVVQAAGSGLDHH